MKIHLSKKHRNKIKNQKRIKGIQNQIFHQSQKNLQSIIKKVVNIVRNRNRHQLHQKKKVKAKAKVEIRSQKALILRAVKKTMMKKKKKLIFR